MIVAASALHGWKQRYCGAVRSMGDVELSVPELTTRSRRYFGGPREDLLDLDRDPSPQSPQSPFITTKITTVSDVCYALFPPPMINKKNENVQIIVPRPEVSNADVMSSLGWF